MLSKADLMMADVIRQHYLTDTCPEIQSGLWISAGLILYNVCLSNISLLPCFPIYSYSKYQG